MIDVWERNVGEAGASGFRWTIFLICMIFGHFWTGGGPLRVFWACSRYDRISNGSRVTISTFLSLPCDLLVRKLNLRSCNVIYFVHVILPCVHVILRVYLCTWKHIKNICTLSPLPAPLFLWRWAAFVGRSSLEITRDGRSMNCLTDLDSVWYVLYHSNLILIGPNARKFDDLYVV